MIYLNKGYTSKKLRQDPLLRNEYKSSGKWNMPIIKKNNIDISNIQLIKADNINKNEFPLERTKTVHFFLDDNKLDRYYKNPEKYLEILAQYKNILTPDYSLYSDMPLAIQIFNVFKNRWCGAFWQDYGLSVIPTVSWSTPESFEFCFDGIESGSIVAISTVGNKKPRDKASFLVGYKEMKKRLNPQKVICLDKPFPEMGNEVVYIKYLEHLRGKNNGRPRKTI